MALFACLFLLCSCGAKEELVYQSVKEAETVLGQWRTREILLPDARGALEADLSEGESEGFEVLYQVADEAIYRIVQVLSTDNVIKGTYIQELKAPYTTWSNHFFASDEWVEGEYCYLRQASLREDGICQILLECMKNNGEKSFYRAQWDEKDGLNTFLIPDGKPGEELLSQCTFMYVDQEDRTYFGTEKGVQCFDRDFVSCETMVDLEHTWQVFGAAPSGKVYLCGTDLNGAFVVWEVGKNAPAYANAEGYIDGTSFVAYKNEEESYLCNMSGIWSLRMKENQADSLMSFGENGYVVDKVCGASVGADGVLTTLTVHDGEYILLQGTEGNLPDMPQSNYVEAQEELAENDGKVKLELAAVFPSAFLKEAVVEFNRQSDAYKIVLRKPESGEAYTDFQTRIQAELSGGGGPALLSEDVIDVKKAAEHRFLREFSNDLLKLGENVLENALTYGEVNGKTYTIPYSFSVTTFVTSTNLVGNKTGWTSSELMHCVKDSGAKVAVSEVDSAMLFSLLINDGTWIDWENRTCHLDRAEATTLLEFAKEYGDQESSEDVGIRLAKGEILVDYIALSGLSFSQMMETLYEGQEVYIGLPASEESGNVMSPDAILINQACEHREEAEAFIAYLLSEECQEKLANDACRDGVSGFPVKKDALEHVFVCAKEAEEEVDPETKISNFMGFDYIREPLSDESTEKVKQLIQSAKNATDPTDSVTEIIYEETPAYFSGAKTAAEVCAILQNRIQLYMDEQSER